MICVSVGRTRQKMVVLEHQRLADAGAELIELRLDWLGNVPDVAAILRDRPTPVVVTCRRAEDQGKWRGREDQRQGLLRTAIVDGVEYVDLEHDIAGSIPRFGDTKRIISYHNFSETPADIEKTHAKLAQLDPDIIKIVTTANQARDVVRILKLVQDANNAGTPTIGFCMGELGVASRILCGRYGAPFTYASFSSERELAPGQLSFEQMREDYHYDQIGAKTKVFAVVGDPIAQSLSPQIHNAAYREIEFDGIYVPFRILKGTLEDSLKDLSLLGVRGFSVTIPHKEEALKFAATADPATIAIGASNTLRSEKREGERRWVASNTDCEAAIESLKLALQNAGKSPDLTARNALVLGAGGAARAIAFGLKQGGARVTVTNRTSERGDTLAREIGCQFVTWENRGSAEADILVNCTPVGMHPEVNFSPYEQHWLHEDMAVLDTVYHPENTLLVKHARERGCVVSTGVEMFVRQAAAQFRAFTGLPAPEESMRETIRREISPLRR